MEYLYNSNDLYDLFDTIEKMYLSFKKVLDVKFKSDEYYSLIGELNNLTKMEDDISLSFPMSSRLLVSINDCIKNSYSCDDVYMYNFVLNRLNSLFSNLCAECENKELEELDDFEFVESQSNINNIYDELYLKYIMRLNNVIDSFDDISNKRSVRFIQLCNIFSVKNISDAFIKNNLCLHNNLISKKEDEFKSDINFYNNFIYYKNSVLFDFCEELLMKNLAVCDFSDNPFDNLYHYSNMLLFKSVLQDINDSDFISLKNDFMLDYDNFDQNSKAVDLLKRCFDLEFSRRFNYKNDFTVPLDENFVSNFISLLKTEECLYNEVMNFNLDGFDNFDTAQSLINYESDLINLLDINYQNVDSISSLVFRDLDFFVDVYNNFPKKTAIISRLRNLIGVLNENFLADGVLRKNYNSIISNHLIDSLKKYTNDDLFVIKMQLFISPILTNDIFVLNGNYMMLERFSDEVSASSLNEDSLDYCFDKNAQLFRLCNDIFDELIEYSSIYKNEYRDLFYFKLCELSDIINSVSDEYFYYIYDFVSKIDDKFVKDNVLSLVHRNIH